MNSWESTSKAEDADLEDVSSESSIGRSKHCDLAGSGVEGATQTLALQ